MAISSTLLTDTAIAISPASIIVNGQPKDVALTVMFFCNLNVQDPVDAEFGRQFLDVFVVPDGDVPTATNQILNNLPIDAGDTFTFSTERLVLGTGDRVYANSSNNGQISATVSYVVI